MAHIPPIRHTIEGSPISVTYGYDEKTGVYLSAYDDRLKYDYAASEEVNNVFLNCGVLGLQSGDGAYLDMHTGDVDIGVKASWPVIHEFLKRYGVPRSHILDLQKKHAKHVKKFDQSA